MCPPGQIVLEDRPHNLLGRRHLEHAVPVPACDPGAASLKNLREMCVGLLANFEGEVVCGPPMSVLPFGSR